MLNPRRKSQYELQFKKWDFRKNRTAEEWRRVAHKLKKREQERKESKVILNGKLINPKKLRKETLRYRSLSAASEIHPQGRQLHLCVSFGFSPQKEGPSPPTPDGFVIRTPSPKLNTTVSTAAEFYDVHLPMNMCPLLMDYLPFHQFNSIFSHAGKRDP